MTSGNKLTFKQLELIAHSLGIRLFEAVMTEKRNLKLLPKEFYRNYFNTGVGSKDYDAIMQLIDLGMMEKLRNEIYVVSDAGLKYFRDNWEQIVYYRPKEERDLAYLTYRINFYCDFYRYRFCENNADHILSAFMNYTVLGLYTSHTTTDVINKFRKELTVYCTGAHGNLKRWIIRIKANHESFIADVEGDPGRTRIRSEAKVYQAKKVFSEMLKLNRKYPKREFIQELAEPIKNG